MTLQQQTLLPEQGLKKSRSYQGVFHANHTALLGNVWRLLTSAICGANSLECFAKLGQNGSWQKMWGGYCQAKMDGSLEEFSGTWPKSGVMRSGIASQPARLVPYLREKEWLSLPAPIATDWKGSYKDHKKLMRHIRSKDHQVRYAELLLACGVERKQIPIEYEMVMGFPIGHTDLKPSVTPLFPSSSIPFLRQ